MPERNFNVIRVQTEFAKQKKFCGLVLGRESDLKSEVFKGRVPRDLCAPYFTVPLFSKLPPSPRFLLRVGWVFLSILFEYAEEKSEDKNSAYSEHWGVKRGQKRFEVWYRNLATLHFYNIALVQIMLPRLWFLCKKLFCFLFYTCTELHVIFVPSFWAIPWLQKEAIVTS